MIPREIGPAPRAVLTVAAVVIATVLALAVAGCDVARLPDAPSPTGLPSTVVPSSSSGAPASPRPTEVPGPPVALLMGLAGAGGGPLEGSLGTFTWDALTSDSPWFVPSTGGAAALGDPVVVRFEPPLEARRWRARWALVTGGEPGVPIAGGEGGPGPIRFAAPRVAGTWSLALEASFGDGREAAWLWRVEARE